MLKPIYENIPIELKNLRQFVNWKLVERDGKNTKLPHQTNGKLAKTNDPTTWSDFEEAQKAAPCFAGIGIVVTDNDDIVFSDFDKCRCPAFDNLDKEISGGLNMVLPEVAEHIRKLNSYTEVSPSGKGIHVFLKGHLPVEGKRKGIYEIYQSGRYATLTGYVVEGFPLTIEERQEELDLFYQNVFGIRDEFIEQKKASEDDLKTIVEKAFKNVNGDKIKNLWNGILGNYPSQSEADLALCNYLAFCFHGDASQIDAAFRASGLMREKWNAKHFSDGTTYGEATVHKAINSYKSSSGTSGIAKNDPNNVQTKASNKIDHLKIAKDAVSYYGMENLAFVSGQRIFRCWDGNVWVELDDRSINDIVIKHLDGKTNGVTKNVVESITDLIRTISFRPDVKWDEGLGVIPVQNGALVYHNGQWNLHPHIREHYRTTLIPVEYDPAAWAPRFEQYLAEVFINDVDGKDKSTLVCEMIGYTLTTSCEYEKFILLIGCGANGKSVLLHVLTMLIGTKQVAAVQPAHLDNQFQRGHLCGKLANIVTEIKEGSEIADTTLKAITSGDLMTAEHKFKKPFEFNPFATCWFGTNHMPQTRDFSNALFRRALIVEFNREFQEHEQDRQLKNKLAAELPGILNIALQAFAGVIQRGQFTIPASCERAKEEWRLEADQVAQFIKDCCEIRHDGRVETNLLYSHYKSWAENAGINKILNKIMFSKRLQQQGAKRGRNAHARFMEGIQLKNLTQEEE